MKRVRKGFIAAGVVLLALSALFLWVRIAYPRPHYNIVKQSGIDCDLIYALIKSESSFRADVRSDAGAVGLMQIKPSTAKFICERENIAYSEERLTDGEYNIYIGCKYLAYLFDKFEEQTALAAYNAGEGTVARWLCDEEYSTDGKNLNKIPYPETANYIKRINRYRKIYKFIY